LEGIIIMKIDLILSAGEIAGLQSKAMNAVISETMRQYLRHHKGQPLPFSAARGRNDYEPEEQVGTLVWVVPPDLDTNDGHEWTADPIIRKDTAIITQSSNELLEP
jgi:hypothetical protein